MRFLRCVFVVVCACAGFLVMGEARAGFAIGDGVFTMQRLDTAKARAAAEYKPITFLYTDIASSCSLCNNAGETIVDELDHYSVIVYVSKATWPQLPRDVQEFLTSEGKYIPKAAVYDYTGTERWELITYEAVRARGDDAFDSVQRRVRAERRARRDAERLLIRAKNAARKGDYGKALSIYEEIAETGLREGLEGVEAMERKRDEGMTAVEEKLKAEAYYEAAMILEKIMARFGKAHAPEAQKKLDEMKSDSAMKREVQAGILYRKAKSKRSVEMLRELAEDYPDTAAGKKARSILARQ